SDGYSPFDGLTFRQAQDEGGCPPLPPVRIRKDVERNLQIARAVGLGLRKAAGIDVHLQRVENQTRHRQRAVALLAQRHELLLRPALRHVDVGGLLLRDRRLPLRLAAAGLIVVANEDPCFVRQRDRKSTSELQSRENLVCRLLLRRPPRSPLFPYTTLFRSRIRRGIGSVRSRSSRSVTNSSSVRHFDMWMLVAFSSATVDSHFGSRPPG